MRLRLHKQIRRHSFKPSKDYKMAPEAERNNTGISINMSINTRELPVRGKDKAKAWVKVTGPDKDKVWVKVTGPVKAKVWVKAVCRDKDKVWGKATGPDKVKAWVKVTGPVKAKATCPEIDKAVRVKETAA